MVSQGIGAGVAEHALRSFLESAKPTRPGVRCRMCQFEETLSGDDLAALHEYLASDVSSRVISDALSAYGLKISLSAVSRHRRECRRLE